jgi:alpha-methylacyl-CoA racemase
MSGPLADVSVVEFGSIGPGPFAAMVLADVGASVVRVERPDATGGPAPTDPMLRGRAASIGIDLKHPDGVEAALRLVETSDVLIEGLRPGVMDRLGLGPDICLGRNPRLVYGRMTGWGQDGPRSGEAGHDIDYIAIAGALYPIGDADRPPVPPLNLIGDFGGGGMLLVVGILAALVERATSGRGDVVDAAMVDGAALLTTMMHGMRSVGLWSDDRAANLLDGGAPFYRTYRTADDRFMAVGALEPQFYAALIDGLGLSDEELPVQYDRSGWPALHERFAAVFAGRTRDEWTDAFAGTDACVAPVLGMGEAPEDEHLRARGTFVDVGGVIQPAPAPRLARSASPVPGPPRPPGGDTRRVLAGLGYGDDEIGRLIDGGAVR